MSSDRAHTVRFIYEAGEVEVIQTHILIPPSPRSAAPSPVSLLSPVSPSGYYENESKTSSSSGDEGGLLSPSTQTKAVQSKQRGIEFEPNVETSIATDRPMPTPATLASLPVAPATPLLFLLTPLAALAGTLRCQMLRSTSGALNTTVTWKLVTEEGQHVLAIATRRNGLETAGTRQHYRIHSYASASQQDEKSLIRVGKLKDTLIGDTYTGTVGSKETPAEKLPIQIKQDSVMIAYESNWSGMSSKPRHMTAAIRLDLLHSKNQLTESKSLAARVKFAQKSEASKTESETFDNEVQCFTSKKPVWDKRLKSYSLNFYGRSKVPSTKSFQLVSWHQRPNDVVLQFAKQEKNKFVLDLTAPFSPLQAFQIALSSVDRKLAVD